MLAITCTVLVHLLAAITAGAGAKFDCPDVCPDGEPQLSRQTWLAPRPVVPPARRTQTHNGGSTDTTNYFFLSTNSDPDGDAPDDVAYTPDGTQVLIAHRDTDNVT